jgi:hypothetical protein|tara:strand:+ start:435 stop:578 length:144 start_codon:yes stop_codon:yes gene_type:complete
MNNNNNKRTQLKNNLFILSQKEDDFARSFLIQDAYNSYVPESTLNRY